MGAGYKGGFGYTIGDKNRLKSINKPISKSGDVRYDAKKHKDIY